MGELPPAVYVILALASFAVAGGLLVWVAGYVRGRGKESRGGREKPAVAPSAGEQELLRVSRVKKGKLVIFVQGRRYRHLREITDLQVGHETIEALKAVLAFAEGWLPSVQQRSTQPSPMKPTVDQEAFLQQLRQSPPPLQRKRPGLFGRSQAKAPRTILEPPQFVEEIDDLVQQRLRERPDMAKRRIGLTTGKDGGICIHVDLQTFDSIDDVPDSEVRGLIQDAILEWEGE
ncbi:MAG: hypothetical protein ISS49_01415 [Anaerolineae bacterium]|nr:hypothetical protein [Anaerolineae bacterium]